MFSLLLPLLAFGLSAQAEPSPAPPAAAAHTLRPIDEATRVQSFYEFRAKLREIVKKRDADALLDRVHDSIEFSFGADASGKPAFVKNWGLKTNPAKSALWRELAQVLAEGAVYEGEQEFTAPYYYSKWPEAFDAFEYMLVHGEKVPVRKEAKASAPVVESVSYLIVKAPEGEGKGFTAVELPNGKKGFVETKSLRSPVGYRAIFLFVKDKTSLGGRWLLKTFIAGD